MYSLLLNQNKLHVFLLDLRTNYQKPKTFIAHSFTKADCFPSYFRRWMNGGYETSLFTILYSKVNMFVIDLVTSFSNLVALLKGLFCDLQRIRSFCHSQKNVILPNITESQTKFCWKVTHFTKRRILGSASPPPLTQTHVSDMKDFVNFLIIFE